MTETLPEALAAAADALAAAGPSIVDAMVTSGIAGTATLTEAWGRWLAAPALQTTDPPAAGEPPVVSPLASGADLLRWIVDLWSGGPFVLGMDASLRRDEVVLLRTSVLYRGTAIPVAWVIVPANTPGAWEPHWGGVGTRRPGIAEPAALGRHPQPWLRLSRLRRGSI